MTTTILRLPAVKVKTGNSRSTIYKRIADGLFPKQVKIGPRSGGWPDYEIDTINAARIAGKTDDEIRELVIQLETARKAAA
jgi:prophage regulatory protein